MSLQLKRLTVALVLPGLLTAPLPVLACSSCGCSLNSDWASQGYSADAGLRFDLRFDYFDQDQLRAGTGTVNTGGISLPPEDEIQQRTLNRNYTLALDYSPAPEWGVSALIPYYDRFHTTIAEGDTAVSTSHTESVGDVRILGRFQGFSADRSTGLQFGFKLPTGSWDNTFIEGPQQGQPLDRGLQPGTGTTDLLVGVYHFGALGRNWSYFAQAMAQQPLGARDGFRPGFGLNLSGGVRYTASTIVTPLLQLNVRVEDRESGADADVANSGATLVHLSPGLSARLGSKLDVFGFFQVPVYQRVNGLQLEPRYIASVGLHCAF
jgi:hypothetical protein